MQPVPTLIEIAIEPQSKGDQERLDDALRALTAEDPSLRAATDRESGQTLLGGVSEGQLVATIATLRETYKVDAQIGHPQVAYRETLTMRAEVMFTHKRHTDRISQFAKVTIALEPGGADTNCSFASQIRGDAVLEAFVAAAEKGVNSVMNSGIVAGFPLIGVKALLIDGAYHDVDSSALAFEIDARAACRDALLKGGAILLEPIVKVAIVTPAEYADFVIRDLRARRGEAPKSERRAAVTTVTALAPLARMFGYADELRARTYGQGGFTMQFDHYAAVSSPATTSPSRLRSECARNRSRLRLPERGSYQVHDRLVALEPVRRDGANERLGLCRQFGLAKESRILGE
jgi:elongation factor G